jgi:hypothetical protein
MASKTPMSSTTKKKILTEKKAIREVITITTSTFKRNIRPLCLFFRRTKVRIIKMKNSKIK